jgi:predicted Kef-type K+ transport protein
MDPVWLAVAFGLGYAASRIGLPPLVGYLAAGFALQAFGIAGGAVLERIAELGVTLLPFTIGLKLRFRDLLKPEVWAGTSIHMLITVVVFGVAVFGLSLTGLPLIADLRWPAVLLIAFAMSFSSTVFAVKVLEEKGELASLHGRAAIGILIMQDFIAVAFLTISTGKPPSAWAIAYLALLVAARPLLAGLLENSGHGELLALFGLLLALTMGAGGFQLVGLKPDLGALFVGLLISTSPKSGELAKLLLTLKDLFLVGFFLSIGLSAPPTLAAFGIAAFFVLLTPIKGMLYFVLLTAFRLRARSALFSSLSLVNYSEFGLIVVVAGVSGGWIAPEWLVAVAIAISVTFIAAAPLNSQAHSIYMRYGSRLGRFETRQRHPEDQFIDPGDAEIAIFGMGSIGTGAYDVMRERYGRIVLGLDYDPRAVHANQERGRNVILGDATDSDLWARIKPTGKVRLVLLAMNNHESNLDAAMRIKAAKHVCKIAAIARHEDQTEELRRHGVDAAFNFYAEAGAGFADHVCSQLAGRFRNGKRLEGG